MVPATTDDLFSDDQKFNKVLDVSPSVCALRADISHLNTDHD